MKLKLIILVTNTNKRCQICNKSTIELREITFDLHLPIGYGTKWICPNDLKKARRSQVHYFFYITADYIESRPDHLHLPTNTIHYLKKLIEITKLPDLIWTRTKNHILTITINYDIHTYVCNPFMSLNYIDF